MKKLKTIPLLIMLFLGGSALRAQDIHFSQFFEAPLWRNPSLAGIFTGDVRVQAVYRDQWNSVTDAYRTGSLNAEIKKPVGKGHDFITTGLQLLYDRSGTIGWTSTHFLPALNYHKSLSDDHVKYLSLGMMGGFVQRRFDASKMTTNNLYETGSNGEPLASAQYSYWDAAVGMSFNSSIGENPQNNYFLGAAYHHFTEPRISFFGDNRATLAPKWVFSGGIKMGITENAYLTIQADHSRQGAFNETVGGALCGIKLGPDSDNPAYTLHAGAFLRWNDALIPVIKLDYNPLSVAISYDVNISKLKPSSYGRGGFEISISYLGFLKKTEDYLLCPRF